MAEPTVCVGYLHSHDVASRFHLSITGLVVREAAKVRAGVHSVIFDGGGHIAMHSGVNVSSGRNEVVRRFLETSAEWLWMVDADMEMPPDTLDRLLASANADPAAPRATDGDLEPGVRYYAPIVGALCFGIAADQVFPTCYGFSEDDSGRRVFRYHSYPPDSMFLVGATGAACLLVHRRVLETIREHEFSKAFPWFQETEVAGRVVGEDLTFCARANDAGFPVWVDTSVRVGHEKPLLLTESVFLDQQSRKGDDG